MTECFDCDNCKESLYGRKYIQMDNGPYCIPCYDAHFANTCDECKELIGHDCRVSRGCRGRAARFPGAIGPPLISAVLPRSCTTRIAITTSTAFVASAATVLWPTSRSPAKARSCCVTTATAASSPPSALPARRQSCQVGAGRREPCSLFLVPAASAGAVGSNTRAARKEEKQTSALLPHCRCIGWAGHFAGEAGGSRAAVATPAACSPFSWGSELGRR